MSEENTFLELGAAPRRKLIVALHGYSGIGAKNRLEAVRRVIRNSCADADCFAPRLPYANKWLCVQAIDDIVVDVMKAIDDLIAQRQHEGNGDGYSEIIFVGHSFGAVLARKLVILAYGEQKAEGQNDEIPAPFVRRG